MGKFNEAAALHFAAGCLPEPEVPVGRHELGGCRVVIDFPPSAAVERSAGTAGEGFDETTNPATVTKAAALFFAAHCGLTGDRARRLWEEALLASMRGDEVPTPAEAAAAAEDLQTRGLTPTVRRRTPAKRTDQKLATVSVVPPLAKKRRAVA